MTFPRYPEYKEAGVEWLGEVPEHWCSAPIKYMALERNSLFLDGDWIESKDISSDGIRYITTGNVGEGAYKEQGAGFISEETFHSLGCTEVYEGDVLISRLNNPIGRACITPDLGGKVVTSVDNVIFRPDAKYHKKFIVYLFSSEEYFKHTGNLARGATMQRISRGLLGNIRVVTPSFTEQTQIARFLDHETARIDALIEEQQRLINLLKEKRQAVISQAVTKGLDPTVLMKDSGVEWLGEVPAHWGITPLKYSASCNDSVLPDSTDDDYEIEYVEISDVNEVSGITGSTSYKFSDAPSRARRMLQDGDVLISTVRTYLRAIAPVVIPPENLIASTGFAVIRPRKGILNGAFLGYLVRAEWWISEVIARSVGVSYPAINASDLISLDVPVPAWHEQTQIARFLDHENACIDALISEAASGVELLQERRSALISAAVTGKIDVRGWQPPASVPTPQLVQEAV